jgi:NodT family efflux transporter outer membrane factor (OMF) lipoprotein
VKNMPSRLLFPALAAAIVLAGCASSEGISSRASMEDPARLAAERTFAAETASPGAWPRSDWWKSLNDPQLDKLIDEALAGTPALRIAEARVRRALAIAQVQGGSRYPDLTVSGSMVRQRFSEHGLVPPPFGGAYLNLPQLQASVSYDLDLWGRNRAAYAAAVGEAQAAQVDADAARLTLAVNIALSYVQLQRAYVQLDVAQKSLQQREQVFSLTKQRYEAGLDSRLALKQAEAALPATREQIAQLRETIALVGHQLAALLGQGPDRAIEIARPSARTTALAQLPSRLPAELLGRRPDILAQRLRVEAASKNIDVAKAQFYPNVSLTAFAGLQSITLDNFFSYGNRTLGIGPAVTLPIFDSGRLRGNLAAKDAEYDAAVEQYNQSLADALREVADQLSSFSSLAEQRKQHGEAQATAQEAYDLALLRFREGVGNYLEVLSAETALLQQQSLEADLEARALNLTINLARALGGGFGADALAANETK